MTLKRSFKLTLVAILLFVGLLAFVIFNTKITGAAGYLSFGGKIGAVTVCNSGYLIIVTTVRPGSYMLTPASIRRTPKSLTTPFPGQSILGLAGTVPIPCIIGVITYGKGLPILMAGASMGVSK